MASALSTGSVFRVEMNAPVVLMFVMRASSLMGGLLAMMGKLMRVRLCVLLLSSKSVLFVFSGAFQSLAL
jgi:hypothetical protein